MSHVVFFSERDFPGNTGWNQRRGRGYLYFAEPAASWCPCLQGLTLTSPWAPAEGPVRHRGNNTETNLTDVTVLHYLTHVEPTRSHPNSSGSDW